MAISLTLIASDLFHVERENVIKVDGQFVPRPVSEDARVDLDYDNIRCDVKHAAHEVYQKHFGHLPLGPKSVCEITKEIFDEIRDSVVKALEESGIALHHEYNIFLLTHNVIYRIEMDKLHMLQYKFSPTMQMRELYDSYEESFPKENFSDGPPQLRKFRLT